MNFPFTICIFVGPKDKCEDIVWAVDLPSAERRYRQFVRKAKMQTAKDGKNREVELSQILKHRVIE